MAERKVTFVLRKLTVIYLSYWSHRKFVVEINWQGVLGPILNAPCGLNSSELPALEAAISQHSPRSVRLHPGLNADGLPFDTEAVEWYGRGRRLLDHDCRPGAFLNYAAGDYYIQDAGSMLALQLANVQPGEIVCDACAAPGGKATGMLEQLRGTGALLANEVIRSRLEILELALARVGSPNYMVTNLELEPLAELCSDAFDCVMIDAPCTGQSMVARGKQSLAAFSERQMEHSASRQQRILRSAAELVKPGGRLIYSTCTFAYAENEAIMEWLQSEYPDWEPIVDPVLANYQSSSLPGCYRLWPHRDHCDGAFAAGLRRSNDGAETQPANAEFDFAERSVGNSRRSSRGPLRRNFSQFAIDSSDLAGISGGASKSQLQFWRNKDFLHYFAPEFAESWIARAHAGVPVAELKHDIWQPDYAASIVRLPQCTPNTLIELTARQAAEYLDGASIRLPADLNSAYSGWCAVAYQQRPLGWVKATNGVLKNHLPKALRKPLNSMIVR